MASISKLSTDWLASRPVFYNTKTGTISHNFNEVVDFENLEFDPEGLNNYLDFGFSVFEQTPVKNVKFLRHSSTVSNETGEIVVTKHDDIAQNIIGKPSTVEQVLDLITKKVQEWESSVSGEIVIPTSGGFDSRLLNILIKNKSRIRSFTYGTSGNQNESQEVVYAKELAKILNTKWEQIQINDYNRYLDDWDNIFGASVHAHGMYHIDFYKKIIEKIGSDKVLLSGIIGDLWSGNVKSKPINSVDDVVQLGYSHNLHADSSYSLLKSGNTLKEKWFEENKHRLLDTRQRILEIGRFKMILLSYLITVPESFGFKVWSPFLDMEVSIAMLNLPEKDKLDRDWQKKYFEKNGVLLENHKLTKNQDNTLLLDTLEKSSLPPLNPENFTNIVSGDYIKKINKVLSKSGKTLRYKRIVHKFLEVFYKIPYLEKIAYYLNIDSYHLKNKEFQAYAAYLTLKPIENLVKKSHERNK